MHFKVLGLISNLVLTLRKYFILLSYIYIIYRFFQGLKKHHQNKHYLQKNVLMQKIRSQNMAAIVAHDDSNICSASYTLT